jgi:hypothetical protein
VEIEEKLQFIGTVDPEGSDRLKRLLDRKSLLVDRNIYGEKFTNRQFSLVFDPLLKSAYEKSQILEILVNGNSPIAPIAAALSMDKADVFDHLKDLMKKNLVEIATFEDRNPVFRKR